jgi:hypothetical protein
VRDESERIVTTLIVHGVSNRNRRVNSDRNGYTLREVDELHARIRAYYAEGWSDVQVALRAGCSDRTVWRYRKLRGLPANFGVAS